MYVIRKTDQKNITKKFLNKLIVMENNLTIKQNLNV